jgi:hypothetical protein
LVRSDLLFKNERNALKSRLFRPDWRQYEIRSILDCWASTVTAVGGGFIVFHAAGFLIHVLLVLAVISIIAHFLTGTRTPGA